MTDAAATYARLDEQIAWMDAKSARSQHIYKRLRIVEIASAALIPFMQAFHWAQPEVLGLPFSSFTSGMLAVILAVSVGILHIGKHHENWLTYRSACEMLKSEKHLRHVEAGPYGRSDDPDRVLAERVEAILAREHSAWVSHRKGRVELEDEPS